MSADGSDAFRSAVPTPVGTLHVGVDAQGTLIEIWLPNRTIAGGEPSRFPRAAAAGTHIVVRQLSEYFEGKRRAFELEYRLRGSQFERDVWALVAAIPYGTTTSYGAIASSLGVSNAARAVGRANGSNPLPLVIPCHRVIGACGRLTGYGGGLPLKRTLLELEGAIPKLEPRLF